MHARAAEAWRLPMHGGFDGFRRVVDLPFIARHATHPRATTRERLGLPDTGPVVLVSFGGFGLDGLALEAASDGGRWTVVTTPGSGAGPRPRGPARRVGPHLVEVDERGLYATGLRYEDLVAASDVVVTKPGYGIVSECLANGTAIVYTSRGVFAEYEVLVAEMPRYLRSAFIGHADLKAGRWSAALDAARSAATPGEHARTDGAQVAAARILSRLGPVSPSGR